jgi:hypothetical protein
MYSEIVEVTPEIAEKWLRKNNNNRAIRTSAVNRFAQDMIRGDWTLSHQGIAFDKKGNLLDGQHRLRALIAAFNMGLSQPVKMNVSYDVPPEAIINMDTNLTRTLVDVAHFSGHHIQTRHAGIARVMQTRGETINIPVSRLDRLEFLKRHADLIEKACNMLPSGNDKLRRQLVRAPVVAAFARALSVYDEKRMEKFANVLLSGMPKTDIDEVVILLRNALLKVVGSGFKAGREQYMKTERALKHYFEGTCPEKLFEATEELFPMPEERGMYLSKKRVAA